MRTLRTIVPEGARDASRCQAIAVATLCLAAMPAGYAGAKTQATTVYSFTGGTDGAEPTADMVVAKNGTMYGTTESGGANGGGTAFALVPPAAGSTQATLTTIWNFGAGQDGATPVFGLTADKKGNLYGFTTAGGSNGYGIAFELSPGRTGYTETVLYNIAATEYKPYGKPLLDSAGNLYGVSEEGGYGYGEVFELSPPAKGQTAWTETALHAFTGSDGGFPDGPLVADASGNLYGTAFFAGAVGYGNVFELVKAGGGSWSFQDLYDFTGQSDGGLPIGGLAIDAAGTLYGTTPYGASLAELGGVFSLAKTAQGWLETTLTAFDGTTCGEQVAVNGTANARLLLKGKAIYGTGSGPGCVFELTPSGTAGAYTFTVVGVPPSAPYGGLLLDKGDLYGVTENSGSGGTGYGTVYEITKAAKK